MEALLSPRSSSAVNTENWGAERRNTGAQESTSRMSYGGSRLNTTPRLSTSAASKLLENRHRQHLQMGRNVNRGNLQMLKKGGNSVTPY